MRDRINVAPELARRDADEKRADLAVLARERPDVETDEQLHRLVLRWLHAAEGWHTPGQIAVGVAIANNVRVRTGPVGRLLNDWWRRGYVERRAIISHAGRSRYVYRRAWQGQVAA